VVAFRGPLHEAARLCAALGLDEALLAARAGSLSVGQQQRVAAARALIGFPPLIIADEPTSALDAASQETFLGLLFDQARTHNSAVMMVSHDARLAPMFDRVLQMDDIAQALPAAAAKNAVCHQIGAQRMIIRLALGSLRARAVTVVMTVLAIALSVMLFLGR
jgi:ABC-type lipoprotein export system ATPase subunit